MNYIKGKEIKVKKIKFKGINIFALLQVNRKSFIWVVLLIIIFSVVLYKFGLIHESLLRNKYGVIKIVIESKGNNPILKKNINTSIYFRNEKGKYKRLRWRFFIFRKKMFKEGQKVKVNSTEGKVKKIGLVETEILTRKGDKIFIPNSLLCSRTTS